jgi:hypothetical protein
MGLLVLGGALILSGETMKLLNFYYNSAYLAESGPNFDRPEHNHRFNVADSETVHGNSGRCRAIFAKHRKCQDFFGL